MIRPEGCHCVDVIDTSPPFINHRQECPARVVAAPPADEPKPTSFDRWCKTDNSITNHLVLAQMRRAYRAGLLRAAEIAEKFCEWDAVSCRCDERAAAIRAEAEVKP
jgi:hypothetical protein